MICIKCHHNTAVINSRPHKKTPQVWRRRMCQNCGHNFTTYERIAVTEEIKIKSKDKTLSNYNPGMLLQSILKSFAHRSDAASDSYWLMQSVEDKLASSQLLEIEIDELQRLIFYTVHNFDKLAGMQYAAQHNVTHLLKKP